MTIYTTEHFEAIQEVAGFGVNHRWTRIRVCPEVFQEDNICAVLSAMEWAYQYGVNATIQTIIPRAESLIKGLTFELYSKVTPPRKIMKKRQ